jgi:hypothetical protein
VSDNPNPREERLPSVAESIADAKARLARARSKLDRPESPRPSLPELLDAVSFDTRYPPETETQ